MSRRATLPGAEELFRTTTSPVSATTPTLTALPAPHEGSAPLSDESASKGVRSTTRRRITTAERGPSGRERHEEKITVYLSPDELFDLEQARLLLRGEHGLAVDRGRIVREALSLIVADLEAKGESSILVRRLRGR
ncbi:MAG: hypothetical protein WCP54_02755 [Actinomycetes bacterium]